MVRWTALICRKHFFLKSFFSSWEISWSQPFPAKLSLLIHWPFYPSPICSALRFRPVLFLTRISPAPSPDLFFLSFLYCSSLTILAHLTLSSSLSFLLILFLVWLHFSERILHLILWKAKNKAKQNRKQQTYKWALWNVREVVKQQSWNRRLNCITNGSF